MKIALGLTVLALAGFYVMLDTKSKYENITRVAIRIPIAIDDGDQDQVMFIAGPVKGQRGTYIDSVLLNPRSQTAILLVDRNEPFSIIVYDKRLPAHGAIWSKPYQNSGIKSQSASLNELKILRRTEGGHSPETGTPGEASIGEAMEYIVTLASMCFGDPNIEPGLKILVADFSVYATPESFVELSRKLAEIGLPADFGLDEVSKTVTELPKPEHLSNYSAIARDESRDSSIRIAAFHQMSQISSPYNEQWIKDLGSSDSLYTISANMVLAKSSDATVRQEVLARIASNSSRVKFAAAYASIRMSIPGYVSALEREANRKDISSENRIALFDAILRKRDDSLRPTLFKLWKDEENPTLKFEMGDKILHKTGVKLSGQYDLLSSHVKYILSEKDLGGAKVDDRAWRKVFQDVSDDQKSKYKGIDLSEFVKARGLKIKP